MGRCSSRDKRKLHDLIRFCKGLFTRVKSENESEREIDFCLQSIHNILSGRKGSVFTGVCRSKYVQGELGVHEPPALTLPLTPLPSANRVTLPVLGQGNPTPTPPKDQPERLVEGPGRRMTPQSRTREPWSVHLVM